MMPVRPPLPSPHPALKVSVVVPARNEEELVGSCLEALTEQEGVSPKEYEVLLVLDRCTDETEARAREIADAYPCFGLHFLDGPGKGSGHAPAGGHGASLCPVARPGAGQGSDRLHGRRYGSGPGLVGRATSGGVPRGPGYRGPHRAGREPFTGKHLSLAHRARPSSAR